MAIVQRELKNGRTAYWIALTDQHGKPVWEHGGFNERKAVGLEAQRKREISEGTYSREIKGRVTVRSWLDYWFTKRKNRTVQNDKNLVRDHVLSLEWFADKPIADVRRRDMLRIVEEMEAGGRLGKKSVSTVYGLVGQAFRRALFEEVIHEDVTQLPRGTLKRKTSAANKRKPYARTDAHALIHDSRIVDDARMWIALAFFTGMRMGEVCGRRWSDWQRDARPLSALNCHSQYADQPLKGDEEEDVRPRLIPVHPELEELLRAWWSDGFELVHRRKPTGDDFIVPTRSGANHTKSTAYKLFQRALLVAGVTNRTVHATRNTFISVARENGARGEVVERVTHNASGQIVDPLGTIDEYTTFGWRSLCEAVAHLDFQLDSEDAKASFLGVRGSRAWTRSTDQTPQAGETNRNQEQRGASLKATKTRSGALDDAWLDAGQRRLLKLAEIDPSAARPGLALCRAAAAVRAGDQLATVDALQDATEALNLAAGGRP